MPITLLDIVLIVVMLISGLLAMVRGFIREVLSIAGWVLAAAVTLYSYTKLLPYAKQYFNNDIVATRRRRRRRFPGHPDRRVGHHGAESPTRSSTAASARSTGPSASCSGSPAA